MNRELSRRSWKDLVYEGRMILVMLIVLVVLIAVIGSREANFFSNFLSERNLQNNGRRVALLSIYAMGVALTIITAGIDLSIGSIIGLVAVLFPMLIVKGGVPLLLVLPIVVLVGAGLGVVHGVLVAKLNLQPFIVTLCGLLIYRGVARGITEDMTLGFGTEFEGLRLLANGTLGEVMPISEWVPFLTRVPVVSHLVGFIEAIPIVILIMLVIVSVVGVFLHGTVWGRHLYALGQNEEAARYSGIDVTYLKVAAYTISGLLAGVAGVIYALEYNAVQPSEAGKMYELYGIAAAVLGGCSLRGGEGTVIGIIVGAIILTVLRNLIVLARMSTYTEDALIGAVILAMVIVDEVVKRRAASRAVAKGA